MIKMIMIGEGKNNRYYRSEILSESENWKGTEWGGDLMAFFFFLPKVGSRSSV